VVAINVNGSVSGIGVVQRFPKGLLYHTAPGGCMEISVWRRLAAKAWMAGSSPAMRWVEFA
jgi:hypothetical protein